MATRCKIILEDWGGYRVAVYRHFDGHPKGVFSDMRFVLGDERSAHGGSPAVYDAAYQAARLITAAQVSEFIQGSKGLDGYGVISPDHKQGDLAYTYHFNRDQVSVFDHYEGKEIFSGPVSEALQRWAEYRGCHIIPEVWEALMQGDRKTVVSLLEAAMQVPMGMLTDSQIVQAVLRASTGR